MAIEIKTCMSPYAEIAIDGAPLDVRVSTYRVSRALLAPTGTLSMAIARTDGIVCAPLAAFAAAAANDRPVVKAGLALGYKDLGDSALVFTGYVSKLTSFDEGRLITFEALDDLMLRRNRYKASKFSATPAELVAEIAADSPLDVASVDLPTTKTERHTVATGTSALEFLGSLQSTAKIPYSWRFDAQGRFVWAPWAAAPAAYAFAYKVNIVKLDPIEEDEQSEYEPSDPDKPDVNLEAWIATEPKGPRYRLETVPHPWIMPGDVVTLAGHPKAADGEYRVDSLEHYHEPGRTRSEFEIVRIAA